MGCKNSSCGEMGLKATKPPLVLCQDRQRQWANTKGRCTKRTQQWRHCADSQGWAGAVGHHRQRLGVGEDVLWQGGGIQTLEHQVALLQWEKKKQCCEVIKTFLWKYYCWTGWKIWLPVSKKKIKLHQKEVVWKFIKGWPELQAVVWASWLCSVWSNPLSSSKRRSSPQSCPYLWGQTHYINCYCWSLRVTLSISSIVRARPLLIGTSRSKVFWGR